MRCLRRIWLGCARARGPNGAFPLCAVSARQRAGLAKIKDEGRGGLALRVFRRRLCGPDLNSFCGLILVCWGSRLPNLYDTPETDKDEVRMGVSELQTFRGQCRGCIFTPQIAAKAGIHGGGFRPGALWRGGTLDPCFHRGLRRRGT